MTRINAGVQPSELCDKHLVAEYRELPRIWHMAIKHQLGRELPQTFRLGKGHLLFFVDKGLYLAGRWEALRQEMRHRGFNNMLWWRMWPDDLFNGWNETEEARQLIRQRINERMPKGARWTRRSAPSWAILK